MNSKPCISFLLAPRLALAGMLALLLLSPPIQAASGQPQRPGAESLRQLYAGQAQPRLWSDQGQAEAALALLRTASAHGLDPAHYQVDALVLAQQKIAGGTADDMDAADKALSAAVLAFLNDVHFGRVKPDFQLPPTDSSVRPFDTAEHLRQALAQQRVPQAADSAAPTIALYRRVQATLLHYRELAASAPAWSTPTGLPADGKLHAGQVYPGLGVIAARLVLLGDLPPPQAGADQEEIQPTEAFTQALKRFQSRHSLPETGNPTRETLAALGVPLTQRVRQLELTLERLRWMPVLRPGRVIAVNVPAYRLWAFDSTDSAVEPLEMRVIVGKAARTQTPLFIGQMSYLEFNPYWNVPHSIAAGEIAVKLGRNPAYLAQNQMELVSKSGQVQGATAAVAAAGLRSGALRVRQRPGAHNVLGAVKFAMPNPMNIYLHSTSAKELFGNARRDLSHGCIRVERPEELARFVLADQPQWSAQSIAAAMEPGPMRTVRLGQVIPVVLFYATAATDRAGHALFANDIYRRDDKLAQALKAP
jgi:murein L,D-transpeptidase YcbB/YkuD